MRLFSGRRAEGVSRTAGVPTVGVQTINHPASTIEAEDSQSGWLALPLYAYRCTQCGHKFETIQNFRAEPELVCPKCQGLLERPLTAPGLHFKGAGWYVNDYAGKNAAPAAVDSTESATPAATPAPAAPTVAVPAATSAPAASTASTT